jgi:hypothetical protein
VEALALAVHAVAASPDMANALEAAGIQALPSTTAQMNERIALERAFWRDALPATGIRMN